MVALRHIFLIFIIQFQIINRLFSQEQAVIPVTIYGKIICDSLKIPVQKAKVKLWTDDGSISFYSTDNFGDYKIDTFLSNNIARIYLEITHENQITKKIKFDTLNFKKPISCQLNFSVTPKLICSLSLKKQKEFSFCQPVKPIRN